MPLGAWALVATIVRQADTATTEVEPLALGNRLLLIVARAVPVDTIELWRSDDRGVTWTFHAIPGRLSGEGITGLFVQNNLNSIWLHSSTDNVVTETPLANPGAGGFTDHPVAFTGAYAQGVEGQTRPIWHISGLGTSFIRFDADEPPANPNLGDDGPDGSNIFATRIPGTVQDALWAMIPVGVNRVRRITMSNPRVLVNAVDFGVANAIFGGLPRSPLVALSSTDYWCSTASDAEPANLQQSVNGGTSWTARNLAAGFWSDVPGVAGNQRKGHATGFARLGTTDYCVVTYRDGANVAESLEHSRIAKFNAGTGIWESYSDRANDGNIVRYAWSGLNAMDNLDFYVATYDPATDTTRIYRLTAVTGRTSKIGKRMH